MDSQWLSSTPLAAQPDANFVLAPHSATVVTQGSVKRVRLTSPDPPACKFPSLASVTQSQRPELHPHTGVAVDSNISAGPTAGAKATDNFSVMAGEASTGEPLASIDHVLATAEAQPISTTRPLVAAASFVPALSSKDKPSLPLSSQPIDAVPPRAPPQFLSGTARLRKALEQLRPAPNLPPVTKHQGEESSGQSNSAQEPASTLEAPTIASHSPQPRPTDKFATLPSLDAAAPKIHMVKLVRSPTAPETSLVVAHLEDGARPTASDCNSSVPNSAPVANQEQAPIATIPTETATLVSLVDIAHPMVAAQCKAQPVDPRSPSEARHTSDALPIATHPPTL
ncbi:hypothetical protein H4R34_006216, partial [Dimargaris verticillata]